MTTASDRAAADATLVLERFASLSEDTGMAVAELQEMFLAEMGDRLDLALSALAAGDLPEAGRLVHAAAGTTGICGAAGLADALTSIESLAAAGRSTDATRALRTASAEFRQLASVLQTGRLS